MTHGVPENLRRDADAIFRAALRGVDPARLVRAFLHPDESGVTVGRGRGAVRLAREKLFVVGVGKASATMAAAVASRVPEVPGVIIKPPGGPPLSTGRIRQSEGNHPVPEQASFAATRGLLDAIAQTPSDAEILFLLSGGASALFAQPREGITRAQKAQFTEQMLHAGAPIGLLNRARLRISALKGGQFAQRVFPRRVTTLALSDVPGGADWEIGSGPTCVPPETVWSEDLRPDLAQLLGDRPVPGAVLEQMAPDRSAGSALGGIRKRSERAAPWYLIGDNRRARQAAARQARRAGYRAHVSRFRLRGEAAEAAVEVVRQLALMPPEVSCVVFGGETTVSLGPGAGQGGRSQELALAAAGPLAGRDWVLLAAGTDGIDGVGGATGAVVGPGTLGFLGQGVVARGLREHDSANVLGRANALVVTGPTGTNVGDLVIALRSY